MSFVHMPAQPSIYNHPCRASADNLNNVYPLDAEASINSSLSAGPEVGDLSDELDGALAGEEIVCTKK